MVKKKPYVFTIGFNPKDPDHVQVADFLNEQGKGNIASFLVRAVLAYTGDCKSNIDPAIFETMIKKLVLEQLSVQKEP